MGIERLDQGAGAAPVEIGGPEAASGVGQGGATAEAAPEHDHAARLAERPRMFASSHMAEAAMRAQLSRFVDDDAAFGVGAGHTLTADEEREVAAAEAASRSHRRERIDWDDPAASLDHLTQIDADRRTTSDAVRCGPAAIAAGVILQGPDATNGATGRLRTRISELETRLEGLPHSGTYEAQRAALASAREHLDRAGGSYEWTVADAQLFQEALYLTARVDLESTTRATGGSEMEMDALPTPLIREYRDLMWGATRGADGSYSVNQPTITRDGEPVALDVFLVNDDHFVLGEGSARGTDSEGTSVVYDPWPSRRDGSAFSERADGEGEMFSSGRGAGLALDVDSVPRMDRMSRSELDRL